LSGKRLVKGVTRAFSYRLLVWIFARAPRAIGVAAGAGERSGGVGPPKPVRIPEGGDSGEWVTGLERSPAPGDGRRPASRYGVRE